LLLAVPVCGQDPLPAIGQWREHLPYNSTIGLARVEEEIWCATPYSLFSVAISDGTVERYSRVTGLNETGIRCIAADSAARKLLVAYGNSNIDIRYRNDIFNIPDLFRDNIVGDKTVYQASYHRGTFFLSTGLGLVLVDPDKYEIRDTWFIGNGGGQVQVNGFTAEGGFFYAATAEGLKRLPTSDPRPADYRNWQMVSGGAGLPGGPCRQVVALPGIVVALVDNSLFVQQGGGWVPLYSDGWPVLQLSASEGRFLLCQRQPTGVSRVVILNGNGTVDRILANVAAVSFPQQALLVRATPWVADLYAGLSRFPAGNNYQTISLNGPQSVASGELLLDGSAFYASAGAVNDSWNYQYNGEGIFRFRDGQWTNYNRYRYPVLDSLLDFITLTADRRDGSIWAGSFGGGLLHLKQGPAFTIYKQGVIGPTVGDPTSYRVSGLAMDRENHLWVSNFGAAEPLRVRKSDGSWRSFTLPFSLYQNAIGPILVDENNLKWIVAPLGNGLLCYDHGSSIDNTADDRWRRFGAGTANGNLPSNDVRCVTRDRNGFIWVGTSDGIGVIPCGDDPFPVAGCEAYRPVIPNGNFAGFLFRGQEVRSIAVDGADRKWVATRNGAFLINPTGDRLISRFTETNSPLLSNDVRRIVIDGTTGEVFFATLKGMCSFRGTATEGAEVHEDVLVFPNPVPPGYTGTIAIRGLSRDAIVKITEPDGRLVYQTRALGGQAVWDGRNYKGERIASGAYLIWITGEQDPLSSTRPPRTAAKLFFISR
jgi:hypothetical protein